MIDSITAAPHTNYHAVHSSGNRPLSDIIWVVMHDEEAPTALSAASWFTNPSSGGSAHECIDGDITYQTLPADVIPWGAAGYNDRFDANRNGYHLEQAGFARWLRIFWLSKKNWPIVERAAYRAAVACAAYKVPVRFVNYKGLRVGAKGITTHAEVTKAFPVIAARFGSHMDPGFGWPRDKFLAQVKFYFEQITHPAPPKYVRPVWFFTFAAWWLGEKPFEKYGPHNMKHRPKVLPKQIDAAVWKDLEEFVAKRDKLDGFEI